MPNPDFVEQRRYLHRILIVALGLSLLFGLVVGRLVLLQYFKSDYYVDQARKHHTKTVRVTPLRGSIRSSLGTPLATSAFYETAYLASYHLPSDPLERKRLALRLAKCVDMPFERVLERLDRQGDSVLQRRLPEEKVNELIAIREEFRLPSVALYFVREGKRVYPKGKLAAHLVGYTKPDDFGDNIGMAGAEYAFNKEISGSFGKDRVEATVTGLTLTPLDEEIFLNATGGDVYLTIHDAIQEHAEQALAKQVNDFSAQGGVCVVMEVGTGAILAMASEPSFDPNSPGAFPRENRTNRSLVHAISPGSVMKVFTSTALIEQNLMSPYEEIDCEKGRYSFRNARGRVIRTISDSHHAGVIPVHQAFAESSNVAFTKLGMRMEKENFHDQLLKLGFGRRTGIELPGEGAGIMYPVGDWTVQSLISVSIGYEIIATPVQVAAAMAAIANDGIYVKPRILKEIRSPKNELIYRAEPEILGRVCSPSTSRIVIGMMEEVVAAKYGTGGLAKVPGYRVAGKTGTTRKDQSPEDELEGRAYYASFVGVAPVEKPRIVIYAWVDEPHVKWGSSVAAPIFGHVAQHALRVLGIPETEPRDAKPLAPETKKNETRLAVADKPAPEPVLPPEEFEGVLMPDLSGLTIREVVEKLNGLSINAEMIGSGIAIRQQPPPNMPLRGMERGLVIFDKAAQQ
jgi:cell division protein FtsI (penicillin-binding protein 3)